MLHTGLGYLAALAATSKRKLYLYTALPMGSADFLVPFEGAVGLAHFEFALFIFAALSLTLSLLVGSKTRNTLTGNSASLASGR
jgi:hypothetical protein